MSQSQSDMAIILINQSNNFDNVLKMRVSATKKKPPVNNTKYVIVLGDDRCFEFKMKRKHLQGI